MTPTPSHLDARRARRVLVLCSDQGVRVPGDKGASLHLMAITRAFAAIGHEVLLAGVAGHGEPPAGVRTVLMPHPGRSEGLERERRKLLLAATMPDAIRDAVEAFAPDVIYERLALFGGAGRVLAHQLGVPHIVEVNALLAREEAQWRGLVQAELAERIERSVLGGATLRIAVSAEVGAQIDDAAPGRPTVVVPNGVELERFADPPSKNTARVTLGLPLDRRLVGFVGALRPWHGVDVAIRALVDVPGAELVVAGDGPVRADLMALAIEVGVADRVRWLGQVPHERIPTVLAAVDVAVAPYPDLDGFFFSPLKLYEYLAAGVPVVASAIGQVPEALGGGRLGRLVTAGDPVALAAGVRGVLSDPAASARTAATARRHAFDHHGWADRARRITEALQVTALHSEAVRTAEGHHHAVSV
jgi:glycosyltransferase involved in cell wall biosynthesis